MRPKLNNTEKRKHYFILRLNIEERLRLKAMARDGKYPCMSDFVRAKIFKRQDKKEISFDEKTTREINIIDVELNRIGVNLNQLAKRFNSFAGYRLDDGDRRLLKEACEMMRKCLIFLQKNIR